MGQGKGFELGQGFVLRVGQGGWDMELDCDCVWDLNQDWGWEGVRILLGLALGLDINEDWDYYWDWALIGITIRLGFYCQSLS